MSEPTSLFCLIGLHRKERKFGGYVICSRCRKKLGEWR